MARRDQFIKSKSDYVLRKKHAETTIGVIYENDHMTIVPDDGMYDNEVAMFSDSNFKFRVRTDSNEKKKHFSGEWVKPSDGNGDYWTDENCAYSSITEESKVVLKPNYSSLKDFAYYGSCEDLIKATIRDIILRYPGGIYYKGRNADEITIDGVKYYSVSNEFDIDIWTPNVAWDSVDNPMRVLSASFDKYEGPNGRKITNMSITGSSQYCPESIIAETTISSPEPLARASNSVTLYTYLTGDGAKVILSKTRGVEGEPIISVEPGLFRKMYDELDDFEKVLLNLKSKPLFRAVIDTPRFNGQGYFYTKAEYVWPSVSEVSPAPDMSSMMFDGYVTRLLDLARFHDENDTDNIWRMMTHTSIKNLDWTFTTEKDGDVEDLTDFDTTRMKAALELYGRQFDDLKRYADNIKHSNTITYDEKSNLPDYFLTDAVENDGWDAYHVGPTTDETIFTNVLYTGSTYSGSNATDANVSFMRRLAIDSDFIQSMKGTRRGLETVLSLFGMKSGNTTAGDYQIEESVTIASNFREMEDMVGIVTQMDDYYYGDDILAGWPVLPIASNNGTYLVPWYDKKDTYNDEFYFQSKGGWEGMADKKIRIPISEVNRIVPTGDLNLYGETLQYMRYARNLDELTALTTTNIFENMVCYVEDISEFNNAYVPSAEDGIPIVSGYSGVSHYFILKNTELSTHLGYVENDFFSCYGWKNVFEEEYDGTITPTCDGTRVLYLESLKTVFIGNNPHVGYGLYDDGEEYVDLYRHLFKYNVAMRQFSMVDENDMEGIRNFGFDMNEATDNSKCHFFKDTTDSVGTLIDRNGEQGEDTFDGNFYNMLYKSNMETGISSNFDEAYSFSVVNDKKIKLILYTGGNEYLKEYLEDVVLKYVEQMMPSTAIFSYEFVGAETYASPVGYRFVNQGGLRTVVAEGVDIRGDKVTATTNLGDSEERIEGQDELTSGATTEVINN